jgi:hypothetical protein
LSARYDACVIRRLARHLFTLFSMASLSLFATLAVAWIASFTGVHSLYWGSPTAGAWDVSIQWHTELRILRLSPQVPSPTPPTTGPSVRRVSNESPLHGYHVFDDARTLPTGANVRSTSSFLFIPLWALATATLLPPLAWYRTVGRGLLRQRSLRRAGRCTHCGYDLRATPARCPECGTPAA